MRSCDILANEFKMAHNSRINANDQKINAKTVPPKERPTIYLELEHRLNLTRLDSTRLDPTRLASSSRIDLTRAESRGPFHRSTIFVRLSDSRFTRLSPLPLTSTLDVDFHLSNPDDPRHVVASRDSQLLALGSPSSAFESRRRALSPPRPAST